MLGDNTLHYVIILFSILSKLGICQHKFEIVLIHKPQMWYRVLVPMCPQYLVLLFVLSSHSIQMQERISEIIDFILE